MADLGNIGISTQRSGQLFGGTISGVVHDEGGASTARFVLAYHRLTGQPSNGTKSSAADGSYTILTNVQYGTDEHFVVELHPTGSENHRIRGFVTPNKGY